MARVVFRVPLAGSGSPLGLVGFQADIRYSELNGTNYEAADPVSGTTMSDHDLLTVTTESM